MRLFGFCKEYHSKTSGLCNIFFTTQQKELIYILLKCLYLFGTLNCAKCCFIREGKGKEISDAHCQLPTRNINGEVDRKSEVDPIPTGDVFLPTCGHSVLFVR